MQIICPMCKNECCTCKGCSPQLASNGVWVCPRCKESYEKTLSFKPIQNSQIVNLQSSSPWRQQIITNHLRKR